MFGDTLDAAEDAALNSCGITDSLSGQFEHMLTCSDGAAMGASLAPVLAEFIPGIGTLIAIPLEIIGHVVGNAIGQCAKETREIIDLRGTCLSRLSKLFILYTREI